jgi:O-acetylhomoserine (thiol)-lyase
MNNQTQAIHLPYVRRDAFDALSIPVYNAVAYEFDDAQTMSDAFCNRIDAPDYARCENPTTRYFEERIKALTGAFAVTAMNSGMAAISNMLMALTAQGKNVVTSRHLFGNTFSLLTKTLSRFGVETRLADLTNHEEVASLIDENTSCVFLEVLTNPQMEVADLRALSAIAHAKNVPLVADTTAIPFIKFKAHTLGVDIEVVSSTKYISGGATSLGGLIIDYGTVPGFSDTVKLELVFNLGAYMGAQTAAMQITGLETLDARYRVQSANALELATRLRELPQVKHVN